MINYTKILESIHRTGNINISTHSYPNIAQEWEVYMMVQQLHYNNEDFYDGDLGKRIEKYEEYKLMYIPIDKIDLEFYTDEERVEEIQQQIINSNGKYPPIVLSHKLRLIDGTHRTEALNNLGETRVLSYVGIKK